jgi:thermostable 8-oxoguanine DNA glycosylase
MAGIGKISVEKITGDNWSTWKDQFKAFLEYKGLMVAIRQSESAEGQAANVKAKALLTLCVDKAYQKLITGEESASKAWRKLEETFERVTNARVIQLSTKLTTLKLKAKQPIAEYLAEIREIKMDLEAANEPVFERQLAVHALRGLPKEYETSI